MIFDGKFLNLKLTCKEKIVDVKVNEETIPASELFTNDNSEYVLKRSIPINSTDEKQIEIKVNPEDKETHTSKVIRFKAKGTNEIYSDELISDPDVSHIYSIDSIADESAHNKLKHLVKVLKPQTDV